MVDEKLGRIVFANAAFEELSGYTLSALRGMAIGRLFNATSAPKISALIDIFSSSATPIQIQEIDLELVRKSRKKIPVNVNSFSWIMARKRYVCISLYDISQLRALHAQQESAQREMGQISKLADIGLLAAGVAHELNNPLMIVQGFAENMDMMLDQQKISTSEMKMQTAEIIKATERMSRIINQMARIVRSDDVQWAIVDLQEIAQDVVRFLNHELRLNEIQVDFSFEKDSLIKCDHNKIEQVMINILSNAVHALETQDQRRIVRISSRVSSDWVELRMWNNGPAIPSRLHEKIMSPFFTTKDVGKGTGLGLSVSYGIMTAHNGTLTFTSNEKDGTEFLLRFPKPADVRSVSGVHSGKGKGVIVVDDDPSALEILANKIGHFGYSVYKSRRAADAFSLLRKHEEVVAVFTDLRMPEMDGLTFLRQVREYARPGLLLFAVSGYILSPQTETELNNLGVSAILKKPLNHLAFARVLSEIEGVKGDYAA